MGITFTKIRNWAKEVGAEVKDYSKSIVVILPNGKKFEFEQRESTSRRVISRGRGTKWSGSSKGLYMTDIPEKGHGGYAFKERSQDSCIEKMSEYIKANPTT